MKTLAGLGAISIIAAIAGTGYFFGGFQKDAPGRRQAFPDPKDILKQQPPSEIFWVFALRRMATPALLLFSEGFSIQVHN